MIVMGVLTAIPFGLAIRQTAHKKAGADLDLEEFQDSSARDERRYAEEREADAARLAVERAAEARKQEELRARQKDVFGAAPATLGKLFVGVELGAPSGSFQPESARARIEEAREYNVDVDFELDLKSLIAVKIHVGSPDRTCETFKDDLEAAWGHANLTDLDRSTWIATGRRATFESQDCSLAIERFAEVPSWIGHGEKIVPVDMLGKPAKALLDKLGPTVDADDQTISWTAVGVGAGTAIGGTQLSADLVNGKIVTIRAAAEMDAPTRDELSAHLTKLFGPTKPSADGEADTWARPPIELRDVRHGIELRIGK